MTIEEICKLIKDSPSNLDGFFENCTQVVQENIPRQGVIKEVVRSPTAIRFMTSPHPTIDSEEFKEHFLY